MATTKKSTATKARTKADSGVVDALQGRLADLVDLHWQVKQAHWNVTGPDFIALHHLFDEQAELVRLMADTVAERLRGLQVPAEGTIRLAEKRSTLDEIEHGLIDGQAAVRALVERYEQMSGLFSDGADVSAKAEDKGTEDMFIEQIREIDKAAYFLRSHLK